MESDTLIDGDSDSTTNGYNSVLAAGAHGPKFTQKTVFGEVSPLCTLQSPSV